MDGVIYTIVAIVLFIVVLGGIVLVHELGHYLTAKALGVRVLEFGIGFPPRARVLRSKGETLWTLNWLPIGGFVRLEGEDGDAADDPRSFAAKPLRVRLVILVAGVAMNIALAFVLFFLIALLATPVFGVRIGQIEPESPAQAAGLSVGDDIGTSAGIAGSELGRWGGLIISGLGQLIDGLIKDPTAPPPASGPIGIAVSLADIFLSVGPVVTLYVAGILSVNLGVVNILPFPPLDGGRSAVLIIKRLFGARVSLRAERLTYAVGFVFLIAFILWISGFDIARLGAAP